MFPLSTIRRRKGPAASQLGGNSEKTERDVLEGITGSHI
jgi:hypothetical protein